LGPENLQNGEIPCFLKVIKDKLSIEQIEIYSMLDPSKENLKDNLPFLMELDRLRIKFKR
jgi:hypothetical protein